jgi:hypothetical protein
MSHLEQTVSEYEKAKFLSTQLALDLDSQSQIGFILYNQASLRDKR